jgi:hypothetical protein
MCKREECTQGHLAVEQHCTVWQRAIIQILGVN